MMGDIAAYLRECSRLLVSNDQKPPFCAQFTKLGITYWVWIDADGNFVPPPHTIEQPTVVG